jgi:hypothetical protein
VKLFTIIWAALQYYYQYLSYHLSNHAASKLGVSRRSGKWAKVERDFKEQHGACAVCGSHRNLNVHHIMPFHLDPALELDEKNLITLCMTRKMCHLLIGHGSWFSAYNPNVVQDAAHLRDHPEDFDKMKAEIETRRKIA